MGLRLLFGLGVITSTALAEPLKDIDWTQATYVLPGAGIAPVTLRRGRARNAERAVKLQEVTFGDLDGDGRDEAAVHLDVRLFDAADARNEAILVYRAGEGAPEGLGGIMLWEWPANPPLPNIRVAPTKKKARGHAKATRRALAALARGSHRKAAQAFAQANSARPADGAAWSGLAQALIALDVPAWAVAREARRRAPDDVALLRAFVALAEGGGALDEAAAAKARIRVIEAR